MPVVTLPDGSQRTFDAPVTVFDVAAERAQAVAADLDARSLPSAQAVIEDESVDAVVIASGSELQLAMGAATELASQGVAARVVSRLFL